MCVWAHCQTVNQRHSPPSTLPVPPTHPTHLVAGHAGQRAAAAARAQQRGLPQHWRQPARRDGGVDQARRGARCGERRQRRRLPADGARGGQQVAGREHRLCRAARRRAQPPSAGEGEAALQACGTAGGRGDAVRVLAVQGPTQPQAVQWPKLQGAVCPALPLPQPHLGAAPPPPPGASHVRGPQGARPPVARAHRGRGCIRRVVRASSKQHVVATHLLAVAGHSCRRTPAPTAPTVRPCAAPL